MLRRRMLENVRDRRRPLARSRRSENIYSSTLLYLKFFVVWGAVLLADFLLGLRFEYLWPFWLFLHSVYDTYKFQGLAFSLFFSCLSLTSDVLVFLFIPVQWVLFLASSYVWIQYVWHTERGICFPTVALWLLFVYVEAAIRLKDVSKEMGFPLDLCRPFAAHSVGYPVVTLGFGFKSYISYKLRIRKQQEVQKENEFYFQLLRQALPPDRQHAEDHLVLADDSEFAPANGFLPHENSNGAGGASTRQGGLLSSAQMNGSLPQGHGGTTEPTTVKHKGMTSLFFPSRSSNSGGASSLVEFTSSAMFGHGKDRNTTSNGSAAGNGSLCNGNTNSGSGHVLGNSSSTNSGPSGGSGTAGSHQGSGRSRPSSGAGHLLNNLLGTGSSGSGGGGSNATNSNTGSGSTGSNTQSNSTGLHSSLNNSSAACEIQDFVKKHSGQSSHSNSSINDLHKHDSSDANTTSGTGSGNIHQSKTGSKKDTNRRSNQQHNGSVVRSGAGGDAWSTPPRAEKGDRESNTGGSGGGKKRNHSQHDRSKHDSSEPNNNTLIDKDEDNFEQRAERLDSTVKCLSADLQASRLIESDLRTKLNGATSNEKQARKELEQLQSDNQGLEKRLHDLVSQKQAAASHLASVEKKLEQEKKARLEAEKRINEEKTKLRKTEDEVAKAVAELSKKNECSSTLCSKRVKELETDASNVRAELAKKTGVMHQLEVELQGTRKLKDDIQQHCNRLSEQNVRLDAKLKDENRHKVDLFAALNDLRRKIIQYEGALNAKDKELCNIRNQYAESFSLTEAQTPPPFAMNGPGSQGLSLGPPGVGVPSPGAFFLGTQGTVPGVPAVPGQVSAPGMPPSSVAGGVPVSVAPRGWSKPIQLNPDASVYNPISVAAAAAAVVNTGVPTPVGTPAAGGSGPGTPPGAVSPGGSD